MNVYCSDVTADEEVLCYNHKNTVFHRCPNCGRPDSPPLVPWPEPDDEKDGPWAIDYDEWKEPYIGLPEWRTT